MPLDVDALSHGLVIQVMEVVRIERWAKQGVPVHLTVSLASWRVQDSCPMTHCRA